MADVLTRFGHAEALHSLGYYNVIKIQTCDKIKVDENSGHIFMELSFSITMETTDDK